MGTSRRTGVLLLGVIFLWGVLPARIGGPSLPTDKLIHLAAFFLAGFYIGYRKRDFCGLQTMILVGLLLEFVQSMTPYRSRELGDWVMDLLGGTAGYLLPHRIRPHLDRWLLSGLGMGNLPGGPGTYASLAMVLLMGWLQPSPLTLLGMLVFFTLAGWQSILHLLDGPDDPSWIVLDEMLGMGAALLLIPFSWKNYTAAFVLFRILDIAKPPGIRHLERVPYLGILLDDLGAGLVAGGILWLVVG